MLEAREKKQTNAKHKQNNIINNTLTVIHPQ